MLRPQKLEMIPFLLLSDSKASVLFIWLAVAVACCVEAWLIALGVDASM